MCDRSYDWGLCLYVTGVMIVGMCAVWLEDAINLYGAEWQKKHTLCEWCTCSLSSFLNVKGEANWFSAPLFLLRISSEHYHPGDCGRRTLHYSWLIINLEKVKHCTAVYPHCELMPGNAVGSSVASQQETTVFRLSLNPGLAFLCGVCMLSLCGRPPDTSVSFHSPKICM